MRRSILAALAGLAVHGPASAEPGQRGAFIRRHRCEIAGRLAQIHRRGPIDTSRDRFIVLALRDRPQRYVQCIFQDRDAAMFCEASSGAYRYAAEAPLRLHLSPQSVAALHALGYRQESARENFSRTVPLGDPPDVGIAADLMLGALYDAYGARLDSAVAITAPHGGPAGTGCGTPTS